MDNYHMDADLIFMDIELPGINGIETSHQLRAADPVVALVFITNMEQYAINGYEVDALDFCHQAHQLLPLFFHDAPRAAQPACAG